jgi:hypothetical protein
VSAHRTVWHFLFTVPLREHGPRWLEVRDEVLLSDEPRRVDYLLLRRVPDIPPTTRADLARPLALLAGDDDRRAEDHRPESGSPRRASSVNNRQGDEWYGDSLRTNRERFTGFTMRAATRAHPDQGLNVTRELPRSRRRVRP